MNAATSEKSAIVVQGDTTAGDGSNLKSHTAEALESLERAIEQHGQRVPDGTPSFPGGAMILPPHTWRDRYYADRRARESKVADDTLSKRFRRAVRELTVDSKQVRKTGEWNWIAQPESTRQKTRTFVGHVRTSTYLSELNPKRWTGHVVYYIRLSCPVWFEFL